MFKLFYILLDGVGDRSDPSLNWVTPLEAAHTPYLNLLARRSVSGLVYPVGRRIAPESDIAVFSMLGYDFQAGYIGRGVVEAVGIGHHFIDGELALRGNFATIGDNFTIIDRRAGRDLLESEARELTEAVNREFHLSQGACFQLIHTIAHRNVLIIQMPEIKLSANISNTDPAYERIGGMGVAKEYVKTLKLQRSKPLNDTSLSKLSSRLINEFTEKAMTVLKNHPVNTARQKRGSLPANIILLRDAGNILPKVEQLPQRYGLKFACIADMPVEKGVAKITGMDEQKAGGVKDYDVKAQVASELIKNYQVVYVHIKGPDEPGHDGDARLKKKIIEEIDARFFKALIERCNLNDVVFAVSSDHSTPCQLKSHSADPVPLIISGVGRDGTCRFTERDASKGSLGRMRGVNVLSKVVSLL